MPLETNEKTYAIFAHPANRKFIEDLEKKGAKIWLFPPIETEKLPLEHSAIELMKNLGGFDWLIFPDVLTVGYFLENLEEHAIDFYELDAMRICAFGETVADCLRFASVHADVVPVSVKSDTLFAEIVEYVGEDELNNVKFLFLKQAETENSLLKKMKEKCAPVFELPVYKVKVKDKVKLTKLKTLLCGGAIDEFIFSSPSDFVALANYFKTENVADLFSDTKVSVTDRVVLQTARENNFEAVGLFHF